MKKITNCILIILIVSCSSKKSQSSITETNFVLAYKKAVLYGCINESTSNNFNKFSNDNKDLGLAVEVAIMQHAEVERAVEKGKALSKKIRRINYSDYGEKKPIFSDCVSFAFSEEIDSLARVAFKLK
jgi:heterodisulfide reductase subunit B